MREIKRIIRSTVIYLFGNVSTKLVTFLLIPIYTAYINPGDFGKYDVDANYATLISSVLFLDVWSGIMRFMYDKQEKKDKYKVIYSGLLIFLGSTILYGIAFFALKDFLDIRYQFWVFLYGLSICVQNLYGYVSRAFGFNVSYAVSGFLSTLVNAGLNVLMIVYFQMNYQVLYISYIMGIVVQIVILESRVHLLTRFSKNCFDKKITQEIFRFSLPLCINSVCYWLLTSYNKVVVYNQLSADENGYFAMAMKFSLALNLIASCFSLAWQELAYSKTENDEETFSFYTAATNIYFKILFIGSIGLISCVAIIFPYFVKPDYLPSKDIVPIYVLATVFSILSTFLGNILGAYKKNNVIFVSTLSACIVNVLLVNLLIGKLGVQAATISMMCGYVVNCLIRGGLLAKYCHLRFDFKQLIYMVPIVVFTIYVYSTYGALYNILMVFAILGFAGFLFRNYIKMGWDYVQALRKVNRL